jgi:hypothetical protein
MTLRLIEHGSKRARTRITPHRPDVITREEQEQIERVQRRDRRAAARRQAARRRGAQRASPISPAKAKAYAKHPHPSTEEVRADLIARAALRHIQPDIERSRETAPGPGVSGYQFVSSLVGPDLAALSPGMVTPYGKRPHATAEGVASNVWSFSPYLRTPYALARALRAAKAGKGLAGIKTAARPRPGYWEGPRLRAISRPLMPAVNEIGPDQVPDYNRDGLIDNRDILEHLRRKAELQMKLKRAKKPRRPRGEKGR